jgi:hypothetical protein
MHESFITHLLTPLIIFIAAASALGSTGLASLAALSVAASPRQASRVSPLIFRTFTCRRR